MRIFFFFNSKFFNILKAITLKMPFFQKIFFKKLFKGTLNTVNKKLNQLINQFLIKNKN